MIASLSGTITHIQENTVILQQNGIGFQLQSPHAKQLTLNETATLHTYLYWNQEQGPSLFGFTEQLEKDVFLLIISCSGIGPKIGISILEQTSGTNFLQAISEENISTLSSLKGIGAKKAEQMCIALRNKVTPLLKEYPKLATKTPLGIWNDLNNTLSSLNYSSTEIKQVSHILKDELPKDSVSFDLLLRKALQLLAKK